MSRKAKVSGHTSLLICIGATGLLSPLLACVAHGTPLTYSISAVGPADRSVIEVDINDRGDLLLWFGVDNSEEPAETGMLLIPVEGPPTDLSSVFPLGALQNNQGVLLGPVDNDTGGRVLRRWINGASQDLMPLPNSSLLSAFNDNGQFVLSQVDGSRGSAFLGSILAKTLVNLGDLGSPTTLAYAMNQSGAVVGASRTGASPSELAAGAASQEAFIYESGALRGIGTFDGPGSVALGINNSQQVIGETTTTGRGESRAFLYDPIEGMRILALDGRASIATDINDSSQLTGVVIGDDSVQRVFVADEDLNAIILKDAAKGASAWTSLFRASSINSDGSIVGIGLLDGQRRAFLATPVPDPCNIALVALLAVATAARWQRKRGQV